MEHFEEILKKGSKNFHEPYSNLLLNEQGVNYKKIGEEAILRNEVGLLILGGGQGTRLGYDGPKGCYKLKKLNLSLFDIFISKINQIEKKYGVKLEKYVMTSEFTDEKTREYLKDGFMFVRQRNVQCIDLNKQPVECFSPNGNGGIFQALQDVEFKCKILNVVGVDNILANIIDPVAIGCFIKENYEILSKSVTKRKNEKAGIFVNQNNKLIIKEYDTVNETTEEHEEEAQANIINHFFDTNFFKKSIVLDYHFSRKKLKVVEGDHVKEIEGYKKELFIFDSFIFSQRVGAMNVPRILEFSPLKNGLDKKEYNEYTCVDDFLNAIELNKRIGKMTVKPNKVCLNDLSGLK